MEEEVLWCGGALLVTLSVICLEFKAHLTSMSITAIHHPIWFGFSGTIICFSTGQWPNTPPSCVRTIWQRSQVMGCSNWDGLGWVGPQSNCSAYVGTPSRLMEKHSRWGNAKCAKLSSRQRVATLKNLKYKIYLDLFNTFLVTTWFHMCYFIVFMSSLLFYNVENSTNKEESWNE